MRRVQQFEQGSSDTVNSLPSSVYIVPPPPRIAKPLPTIPIHRTPPSRPTNDTFSNINILVVPQEEVPRSTTPRGTTQAQRRKMPKSRSAMRR